MIPRTYPSRVNSTTGRVEALVSFISSTTGLQRWVDYTPVAFVTDATPVEGSYDNDGYIAVADVGSTTGLQAGKDYIRVYLDPNATDAWRVNSVGFIPVGYSGIGGIPYALFANNEQGVWYDPSDTATLFQDSAGTTPVTAVEQPVGLMLDKSKGLVLGGELVTNGTFDTDTAWTKGTGWSISGGKATHAAGSAGDLSQAMSAKIVAGKWYAVTFTVSGLTAGTINAYIGGVALGSLITNNGTYTRYALTASTANLGFGASSVFDGSIDNISVRELPGNHAFQATSTSRPVLSARYNLLTKTEQFDDAVWQKSAGVTVTANAGAAPDGTISADRILCSGTWFVGQTITLSSLPPSRLGFWVKSNTGSSQTFRLFGTGTNQLSGDLVATTTWQWFPFDYVPTQTAQQVGIVRDTAGNAADLLVWGADLRVTNDAAGQPAYQRVNTATDYDTAGFKPYLRFDGTDDWMQTNSINFTATDKMTVFAGVRKLSDASSGFVFESSSSYSSNIGTVGLQAPYGANQYAFVGRGNSSNGEAIVSSFPAPITNVLSASYDFAAVNLQSGEIVVRANGGAASTTYTPAGTTNMGNSTFGAYPLYIGRRGGTTFPFNGRLYGLIVRGAATTTATIQATETYMNGKTGAY